MTSIVLDASALLAMLRDEPGGDKVADVLNGSHMCVVNLAEVTSHFVHNDMPPHEVDAMLHPLPVTLVEADAELARVAGHLRAVTRSEEHTSELQSLMRISYAVFCLKNKHLYTMTLRHTTPPSTLTQPPSTSHSSK